MMTAELRCQVYPGQFSNEYAVVVESFNGRDLSLFTSREDVQCEREPSLDDPSTGWLKVKLLERKGNNFLVLLPQTTLESGSYLAVRHDQLRFDHEVASV